MEENNNSLEGSVVHEAGGGLNSGVHGEGSGFSDIVTIEGTAGNDILNGTAGDDVFRPKSGDDIMSDSGGNDIYLIDKNLGIDVIEDSSGIDTLKFPKGRHTRNLDILRSGDDLVVKTKEGHEEEEGEVTEEGVIDLTIKNWFANPENKIENFVFTSGPNFLRELNAEQIESLIGSKSSEHGYTATIIGTTGDDILEGTVENDVFFPDTGNDTMTDTLGGNDMYIYAKEGGKDVILDTSGDDTLVIQGGYNKNNITVSRDGDDLLIGPKDTEEALDQIKIINWFADDTNKIENFEFTTGNPSNRYLSALEIESLLDAGSGTNTDIPNIVGTLGDDTLLGTAGNDIFDPNTGNDYMEDTLGGDDIYLFKSEYNENTILDTSGYDRVKMLEGLVPNSIKAERVGDDIVISPKEDETNDFKIIVKDWYTSDNNKIEVFEFLHGAINKRLLSADDIEQLVNIQHGDEVEVGTIVGTEGNDTLIGTAGNDIFNGKSGNDYLEDTLGGDDVYLFDSECDKDIVLDTVGNDTIRLTAGFVPGNTKFTRAGDDLVISPHEIEEDSPVITVKNWFVEGVDSVEKVMFSAGNLNQRILYREDIIDLMNSYHGEPGEEGTIIGTDGDDLLVGTADNDIFDPKAGKDMMVDVAGGDDTYIYAAEYGEDTIFDTSGTADRIKFKEGYQAMNISVTRDGDNLVIAPKDIEDPSITDKLIIQDWFTSANNRIESFEFTTGPADQRNLTASDIEAMLEGPSGPPVDGTSGDDIMNGGNQSDLINGKGGNDLIAGGDGDDKINGDAGNDTIFGEAGNDIIDGGIGNDVAAGQDGNDIINGNQGNDSLFGGEGNDTLTGWTGDDIILGEGGDDVLSGETGNDLLAGGDGDDSMNGGDGNDTFYGEAGNDTIYGGTGNDFIVDTSGNDKIYGNGGNDTIHEVLGDDFVDGGSGDDYIVEYAGNDSVFGGEGNDGLYDLGGNDYIDAGAGNDIIHDLNGNDTLIGGTGDDFILDFQGNDLYKFSIGDGNDAFHDRNGTDILSFDPLTERDDLIFLKKDNHLNIKYTDNDGGLSILEYFGDTNSTIETVQLESGYYMTDADINQLIQNMTAYATQNGIDLNNEQAIINDQNLTSMIVNSWHPA